MKNILTLTLILPFFACNKDKNGYIQNPNIINFSSPTEFLNSYAPDVEVFSIDPSVYNRVVATNGTAVEFNANQIIDQNGNIVLGTVDVAIKEILSKKDMIYSGLTSMGATFPLISGGEVFINISQNGNSLRLNSPVNIFIPDPTPEAGMMVFRMTDTSAVDVTGSWVLDTSTILGWCNDPVNQATGYCFTSDTLYWINCDYFANQQPSTGIEIEVPLGFNNLNTMIYLSFDNLNSITRANNFNSTLNRFSLAPNYNIPIGIELTIIAVGVRNNQIYGSSTPIMVVNNHLEVISLSPVSEIDLVNQINNLQ